MFDKQGVVAEHMLDEAVNRLPDVQAWDETIAPKADVLIVALGFEDRAVYWAEAMASSVRSDSVTRAQLGVVARYGTNCDDNARNENKMRAALATVCDRVEFIDGDSPQSIESALQMHVDRVTDLDRPIQVAFDVSAASGTLILSVMHALLSSEKCIALDVFYVEPECYHPSLEEYERNGDALVASCCAVGDSNSPHEFGVEIVQVNELYPGCGIENRPEFVIAVPSFRTERLRYCLQHVSDQLQATPDKNILWLLGAPPADGNRWRVDLQRRVINRTMASMVGLTVADDNAPRLNRDNSELVSTLDYRKMTETVMRCADTNLGDRITVIHMGSKMQALGLSLALAARREVAVCYARPTRFNPARYSSGCSTTWVVRFGALKEVMKVLGRVGQLQLITTIETEKSSLPQF